MGSYAARTKYDEPGRAARYGARSPKRSAKEWALLARMVDALDPRPQSALDVPCGTGRIAAKLLDWAIPTRGADISPAMRREAEKQLADREGFEGVFALDLEALPDLPPEPADLVVCFRLLHHLPNRETRIRVLRSLRALTRQHLLVSFHHPISLHNLERRVRRLFGGKPSDRYTISRRRLAAEAAEAGFAFVRARGLAPYRREFWIAHLQPRT